MTVVDHLPFHFVEPKGSGRLRLSLLRGIASMGDVRVPSDKRPSHHSERGFPLLSLLAWLGFATSLFHPMLLLR